MSETMRERFERAEDGRLAPWAQRSTHATRRYRIEGEGRAFDYRTHFQRDRDRIVYSRAFRRLRQKAQSGILPAYEDHRRNRLTHTLEVTQLARTIGRALGLNEDLIEAIALAHDLGQPPFGPAGERALDDLLAGRLDGRGGPGLGDLGGFSRAMQSLRTVDLLEKRYAHPGLNLTDPVREGIVKSGPVRSSDLAEVPGVYGEEPPTLETQVLVVADRIAEALHDLDDALQSGAADVPTIERLKAVAELRRKLGSSYRPRASRFMKANTIHRGLTHLLVTGVILAAEKTLAEWADEHGVEDDETFRAVAGSITGDEIALPPASRQMLEDIEAFLDGRIRRGFEADRVDGRGRRIVLGLFAAYHADPTLLEPHVLFRFKEIARVPYLRDIAPPRVEAEIAARYRSDPRFVRVLADYISGMTDSFAVHEHRRLMEMGAVPIPGTEQLRREQT